MGIRPGRCHRTLERPYTRVSNKLELSYVKGAPSSRIGAFEMGNPEGDYDAQLWLISLSLAQIRHNALEAARTWLNKILTEKLGQKNFYLKLVAFPHQVLREKPIATAAGADRYSQGMRLAFGKPIGRAVRSYPGQVLMILKVKQKDLETAKDILKKAGTKLPVKVKVEIETA